jgi:hypothetical protein
MQQVLHWANVAAVQQTGRIEKVQFFFGRREPEPARSHDIANTGRT